MVQLRTAALVFEDGGLSHIVNRIPFRYRRVCAVQFYLRSKFDANTCSENRAAAVRNDDLSKCCDGQAACSTQTCPTATHVNKPDYDSLKCAGAVCEPDFSECCDVKADCSQINSSMSFDLLHLAACVHVSIPAFVMTRGIAQIQCRSKCSGLSVCRDWKQFPYEISILDGI